LIFDPTEVRRLSWRLAAQGEDYFTHAMIERIFALALSTTAVARGASLDLTGVRHHWQLVLCVVGCFGNVQHTM